MTERDPQLEQDLFGILEMVLQSYLGMAPVPMAADEHRGNRELWIGSVGMTGGFNGAVTLSCSREFATHAAHAVFGGETVAEEEGARDVVGELTNMLGGNVKCLLAASTGMHSQLSLPMVSSGAVVVPGTRIVTQCWVRCGSEPLGLTLYEARASAKAS